MWKAIACAAMVTVIGSGSAFADGDAAKGEKTFKKCAACHAVGENAKNKSGPVLTDVIGRTAGTFEGYKYSKLNSNAGEAGLTWTEESIIAYLADPKKFLVEYLKEKGAEDKAVGSTKMSYKLPKEDERADIAAYLKSLAPAQ